MAGTVVRAASLSRCAFGFPPAYGSFDTDIILSIALSNFSNSSDGLEEVIL